MTMMRKKYRSALLALLGAGALAAVGAAGPASAAPALSEPTVVASDVSPQAAEVQVFLFCEADGTHSWNAVGYEFKGSSKVTVSIGGVTGTSSANCD
jgi:ABC-type glycerol-3-phosphate transport system substrate-binding protein